MKRSASALARTETPKCAVTDDLVIKSVAETAISMLQAIYNMHKKGTMTLEEAKKLGVDLMRELRYGTDGYFWVDTTEGVTLALYGHKELEGKNRMEEQDATGKYITKETLALAKAGGGYCDYWFFKMGQTSPQPKRSYVLPFKPFGWVIGCGYYLEKGWEGDML